MKEYLEDALGAVCVFAIPFAFLVLSSMVSP